MCISILCDLNACVCMFMCIYIYIYMHSCASMSSTLYIVVPCTLSGGRGALQMPPDCNICSVLLRLCNGIFYPLAQDLKLVSFAPISGIRFSCSLVPCSLRLSEPVLYCVHEHSLRLPRLCPMRTERFKLRHSSANRKAVRRGLEKVFAVLVVQTLWSQCRAPG